MFLAISLLLGIPSAILFVSLAWGSIQLYLLPPARTTPPPPSGNAIIDGLVWGTLLIAKALSLANAAAEWVMRVATVFSLCLTVVAALLFAISRGLHASRTWARILGIFVASAPLILSILIMTSFWRPVPMALGAGGALLTGYAIWVLGWRFF